MPNDSQPTPPQQTQPILQEPISQVTPIQKKITIHPLVVVLLGVIVLVIGGIGGYYSMTNSLPFPTSTACTMEAKVCPDGSSVGRSGPKCEFSPCPTSLPSSPKVDRNQLPHIPEIGGKFFTSDDYISQDPTIYLCVSTQDEFKTLVEKIVNLEKNKTKYGYEKDWLPQAKWIQKPEYFYVNFMDATATIWDILNCNYFTSSSTIPTITQTQKDKPIIESLLIGTFKQPISEESVNNLITILHGSHMLPQLNTPGWTLLTNYSNNINDTSNEMVVTKTIDGRFCGDMGGSCSESRSIYKYRVVKNTGEVFFSYFVE